MTEEKTGVNPIKNVPFTFEDNNYEIQVFMEVVGHKVVAEPGFKVRIMKNGQPLPVSYSVTLEEALHYRKHLGENAWKSLVDLAKKNVLEKTFEPR